MIEMTLNRMCSDGCDIFQVRLGRRAWYSFPIVAKVDILLVTMTNIFLVDPKIALAKIGNPDRDCQILAIPIGVRSGSDRGNR